MTHLVEQVYSIMLTFDLLAVRDEYVACVPLHGD